LIAKQSYDPIVTSKNEIEKIQGLVAIAKANLE
jgi:hypothetical protein